MSKRKRRPGPSRGSGSGGAGWLWGRHAVLAALANPDREASRALCLPQTVGDMEAAGAERPKICDRRELESHLPDGAVHQGFALLASPPPEVGLEDVLAEIEGDRTAILVLDQASDPRNVGAVLRSAAAFGAAAVVVQDRHSPESAGVMAKAASGALERTPLVRATNLARALELLRKEGFWTVGLDADADKTLAEANPGGRVALVLGSEGEGLRRLVREGCDLLARIPMTDAVESLNVSNAAAVVLYEISRA